MNRTKIIKCLFAHRLFTQTGLLTLLIRDFHTQSALYVNKLNKYFRIYAIISRFKTE